MHLLPEEVPLPSSLEASAVRGRQRAVPSDPLVRRRMAEKLAARRKPLPYGGVAKRRWRSRTASSSPELSVGDQRNPTVRNMGNFNFSWTHVLTIFHHVEQCCYPSFLSIPHIPAMTSHVAYVIYATFMLITTQGLCNITFFLCLPLMHLGPYFSYVSYPFSFLSYPCRLTHSV